MCNVIDTVLIEIALQSILTHADFHIIHMDSGSLCVREVDCIYACVETQCSVGPTQ